MDDSDQNGARIKEVGLLLAEFCIGLSLFPTRGYAVVYMTIPPYFHDRFCLGVSWR